MSDDPNPTGLSLNGLGGSITIHGQQPNDRGRIVTMTMNQNSDSLVIETGSNIAGTITTNRIVIPPGGSHEFYVRTRGLNMDWDDHDNHYADRREHRAAALRARAMSDRMRPRV